MIELALIIQYMWISNELIFQHVCQKATAVVLLCVSDEILNSLIVLCIQTDFIPYFNVSDQSDCSKRGDLFHLLHLPVHLLHLQFHLSHRRMDPL